MRFINLSSECCAVSSTFGWLLHLNYVRPHRVLKGKTPAEVAVVKYPHMNWQDIVAKRRISIPKAISSLSSVTIPPIIELPTCLKRNDKTATKKSRKQKTKPVIVGLSKDTKTMNQRTQFDEKYVISEVLRSKAFSRFYMAERIQIVGSIDWVQDLSLPEGINYRKTTYLNGNRVIYLRRVPATLEDDMSIAHELQHFVLEDKGFPSVGSKRQFENIASALNSMVHDPLVDIQLQNFGFDLYAKYEKEEKETRRRIQNIPKSPPDYFRRILWTFNYVSNVLDWELVRSEGDKDISKLQSLRDECYPDITEMGQELLALVRRIEYDTPEKMHKLFKETIQRYELNSYLVIGYPGTKRK